MTDLGFGLADRRSVLVVLFVFILAYTFLNYPLPVDTSSAIALFIGLILLTGYIYLVRTACRLILLTIYLAVRIPFDLTTTGIKTFKAQESDSYGAYPNPDDKKQRKPNKLISILRKAFTKSFEEAILRPFVVKDWHWDEYYDRVYGVYDRERWYILGVLGVIDRLILIGVAFAAIMPNTSSTRNVMGFFGIGLLLLVYIFTGRFTFALKDAFQKSEEDHNRLVSAASHPNINFPSKR